MRRDVAELIRRAFCEIFCGGCGDHQHVRRSATYRFKGVAFQSDGAIMITIKDTDVPGTVNVSVSFVDAKGKPARVDGVPTWEALDPTVVDRVTPAADGLSAELHVLDNPGSSQLKLNADVDLGAGVENKEFIDVVNVIPGDAVAANFVFSAVTPDPAP